MKFEEISQLARTAKESGFKTPASRREILADSAKTKGGVDRQGSSESAIFLSDPENQEFKHDIYYMLSHIGENSFKPVEVEKVVDIINKIRLYNLNDPRLSNKERHESKNLELSPQEYVFVLKFFEQWFYGKGWKKALFKINANNKNVFYIAAAVYNFLSKMQIRSNKEGMTRENIDSEKLIRLNQIAYDAMGHNSLGGNLQKQMESSFSFTQQAIVEGRGVYFLKNAMIAAELYRKGYTDNFSLKGLSLGRRRTKDSHFLFVFDSPKGSSDEKYKMHTDSRQLPFAKYLIKYMAGLIVNRSREYNSDSKS
jgi:hypothetical protein